MADTAAPGAEPSSDAPVSNRSEKHKSTGPSGSAPTGGGGATPPNRPASGRNAATTTTTTTTTTSTVAKGGAAGPATLQLPPAVAEFGKRLEAAKQRSRFGFVRTNKLFHLVSFSQPVVSATLLAFALSLYFASTLMAASLPSLLGNVAVLALLASGGIAAFNTYAAGAAGRALPLPQLTLDAGVVGGWFNTLGAWAVSGLEAANRLLSWSDPFASMRALGYCWLLARFSNMLSPGWLALYAFLSFALAPAYLLNQPMADGAYTASVLPQAKVAAAKVGGLQDQVSAWLRANQQVAMIGMAVSTTLFVYFAWNHISFTGIMTTGALLLGIWDALHSVAGTAANAGGATGAARTD